MGRQVLGISVAGIRRAEDRGMGELANGDVIRMTVVSIGREGNDHLRPDPANLCDDFGDGFGGIRLVYIAIYVVEEVQAFHTQFVDRVLQFPCADLAESLRDGILLLGTESDSLAARGANQIGINPCGGILRQRTAHAHRFIIGVCKDRQQFQWAAACQWRDTFFKLSGVRLYALAKPAI